MIRLCHYAAHLIKIYCTSPPVQCSSKATESYESYLGWCVLAKEAFCDAPRHSCEYYMCVLA